MSDRTTINIEKTLLYFCGLFGGCSLGLGIMKIGWVIPVILWIISMVILGLEINIRNKSL